MEKRPGEFGWSHTEAEVQAVLKEVTGNIEDEESNFNDKAVTDNEERLLLQVKQSTKNGYRRPSKFEREAEERKMSSQRRSISQRMSLIRAQIEAPPVQPEENTQEEEEIRLETIAREGLKALYERQLKIGKGMQRGPHIVPYRFLGTPDLTRGDSLLPKTFQFAKREKFPAVEPVAEFHQKVGNQPMVLPLQLRAAYWNGGRWCGTASTARQVSVESGFKYLYQEVVQSERRRVNCRGGKYFLGPVYSPKGSESGYSSGHEEGRRLSFVSEFTPRQKTRRPSAAKPYIPPLPLKDLSKFDLEEELSFNQEILSAYRDESTYRERLATERAKSPEYEAVTETERRKGAKFGTNGFPLKACEESSLRQLESILHAKASFRAMQHDLNSKLVHSLKAMETARPYHYAREFKLKGGGRRRSKLARDPAATPRRANALRAYMAKSRWFEDLIEMAYLNGRHPTKTELFIINDIRRAMDQGINYGLEEYTLLIQRLGKRKMDMDTPSSEKTLVHIQTSLQLDDVNLVTNLLEARSRLPAYLERKTNLVKQVIRDLAPNRFPQSQFVDRSQARKKSSNHRQKIPPSPKFRKLLVTRNNQPTLSKRPQVSQKAQTARF